MAELGIDVSHHQGVINWQQVVASGKTFALVKRTEGTSFVDPRGTQNAAGMRAAGLEFPGDYHFLSDRSDPAAQARFFLNTIGDPTGRLTALDVERTAAGGTPTSAQAHAFAAEWFRLTNNHPLLVYTGHWYWVGVLKNPHGADIGPLWHSEYETTDLEIADGPELDRYGGWGGATFWQYTRSGFCPGVAGSCDLDLFFGDRAALRALAGLAPVPPIPIPTPEDLMPFPVIAAPDIPGAVRPWTALLPGKVIRFVDWDPLPTSTPTEAWAPGWAYYSGVKAGYFEPVKSLDWEGDYDQAVAAAQHYSTLPAAVAGVQAIVNDAAIADAVSAAVVAALAPLLEQVQHPVYNLSVSGSGTATPAAG